MPDATPDPPLRADARRNRDALLVAARDVFAQFGLEAPLDAIAKQAGVGRATLYRRFATRDALIAAIFDADFDALAEVAEQASSPAQAFFDLFDAAMAMQTENLGFIELWTRRGTSPELLARVGATFASLITPALTAAQEAGLVRSDITVIDFGNLLLMTGAVTASTRGQSGGDVDRARAVALVHDALDPSRAPRPLPSGS